MMSVTNRLTLPLMRFALLLGALLTFISGVQLFMLTERTADYFAWTIAAGSSATIIGAFYWTACVLSYLSWRRQPWVRARSGVPGVTLFLWATLFTTLVHLDKFHFSGSGAAWVAAWAWLLIYIADPVLVTFALVLQRRAPGVDPPAAADLSLYYRILLWCAGTLFAVIGLMMLLLPGLVIGLAPWPLTPLTSRTIGAWVLAMGAVFATMAWENDADRIQPAVRASLVLPVLLLMGVMRYKAQFRWDMAGQIYMAMISLVATVG
ncbi:MAG: hypothetical protein WBJ41_17910, partial [Chromatiaceae bacterium]